MWSYCCSFSMFVIGQIVYFFFTLYFLLSLIFALGLNLGLIIRINSMVLVDGYSLLIFSFCHLITFMWRREMINHDKCDCHQQYLFRLGYFFFFCPLCNEKGRRKNCGPKRRKYGAWCYEGGEITSNKAIFSQ